MDKKNIFSFIIFPLLIGCILGVTLDRYLFSFVFNLFSKENQENYIEETEVINTIDGDIIEIGKNYIIVKKAYIEEGI